MSNGDVTLTDEQMEYLDQVKYDKVCALCRKVRDDCDCWTDPSGELPPLVRRTDGELLALLPSKSNHNLK